MSDRIIRQSVLDVLGLRLPVMEAGPPGADEAIVFLHGHPGSSRDWEQLLPRVAHLTRAVAFDMPGFGRADKPDNWDHSPGGNATLMAAVLRQLGIRRAHLVMHDFGGAWGLFWGVAHPDAFASAVLIDTGVLIGYRWHPVAAVYRTRPIGEIMSRLTTKRGFKMVMALYDPPRRLPPEFIERMWDEYDMGTRRTVLKLYRGAPPDGFERLVPTFRELDPPTLVIWGGRDVGMSADQAELQKRSFPSAEVHVLEDSGHWPFIDNLERVSDLLVPFLEHQVGRDRTRAADASAAG